MNKAPILLLAFTATLTAQDLLPEITQLASKHRVESAALAEQKAAAITRARQPYIAALDAAEKAATSAGQVQLVAALNKEREAITKDSMTPAFPSDLPKNLQPTRKAYQQAVVRTASDFVPRQQRIDANYLRSLAALQDSSGGPSDWNLHDAQSVSIELDNGNPFIRFTAGKADQWVSLPPKAKEVTISARVRCPDFAKRSGVPTDCYDITVAARATDGNELDRSVCNKQLITQEKTWKRVTATGALFPGIKDISARIRIRGIGTLDIDDVEITVK